jgi:biopolymer transport protein ExbB
MNIELIKITVDYGVIGLLLFMSFLSLWIYIERVMFFKKVLIEDYNHIKKLEIDLTNNITIISSIAVNSVYVGLLGTVFGIIVTFYSMGQDSQFDVKIIMSSLALALKATALGLIVAIPAIFFYNHITRKIEVLLNLWNIKYENKKV